MTACLRIDGIIKVKMKNQTTKKLLEELMELIRISSRLPVRNFTIRYFDDYGLYDPFDSEDLDLDGVVSKLMGLSLTHRMAKIHYSKCVTISGVCIYFYVLESNDGTTNIDADMLDLILKLHCEKFPFVACEV